MMDPYKEARNLILEILQEMQAEGHIPQDADLVKVSVTPSKDEAHGQISTNAALVLAKPSRKPPTELAGILEEKLLARARSESSPVRKVTIAGKGFVNLWMENSFWSRMPAGIIQSGSRYGQTDLAEGKTANIEFVSANPTGPLHAGHLRGAVYGDALAALLDFTGWKVTREYYINDAGSQIRKLAESLKQRCLETTGETPVFPENGYPGEYLVPVAEALMKKHGDALLEMPEEELLSLLEETAVQHMMLGIMDDLSGLGVRIDAFIPESEITGQIPELLKLLEARDLVYQGVLEAPPKGQEDPDWTPRKQLLFRSTRHGDDVDRPLQKEDGSWTYLAADLAYHAGKISRGFDLVVDVWGEDHGGYVSRMQALMQALSPGTEFDIRLCRLVRLLKDGRPVAMSKRAGNLVTLRELLNRIGPDSLRFGLLGRKNDAALDLDLEKAVLETRENPVFYVQYAHARACSILEKGGSPGDPSLQEADSSLLSEEPVINLIRQISWFPSLVEAASRNREPHRIAFYLQELAAGFHGLYTLGKIDPSMRMAVPGNPSLHQARMALVKALAVTLKNGLGILGIIALDKLVQEIEIQT